jgi:hypothetical protein
MEAEQGPIELAEFYGYIRDIHSLMNGLFSPQLRTSLAAISGSNPKTLVERIAFGMRDCLLNMESPLKVALGQARALQGRLNPKVRDRIALTKEEHEEIRQQQLRGAFAVRECLKAMELLMKGTAVLRKHMQESWREDRRCVRAMTTCWPPS